MTLFSSSHRVSYDAIRALAIEYHALELSASTLFFEGTHKPSRSTKIAYEELVTTKLLMLAISLRTKFYQGTSCADTEKYVVDCGFLDVTSNGVEKSRAFSIKDICDKIIHTDELAREITDGNNGFTTTLSGKQGSSPWKLYISLSLFTEAVLNWLDDLPDA